MIVSVNAEKALKKIHEEKVQSTRKRKESGRDDFCTIIISSFGHVLAVSAFRVFIHLLITDDAM